MNKVRLRKLIIHNKNLTHDIHTNKEHDIIDSSDLKII